MPTVYIDGYKFRFYASDGSEPPHVHVLRDDKVDKIWLQPVLIDSNHGYSRAEINRIVRLTRQNQARLLEVWNAYFSA
jgi:hypothetical protein